MKIQTTMSVEMTDLHQEVFTFTADCEVNFRRGEVEDVELTNMVLKNNLTGNEREIESLSEFPNEFKQADVNALEDIAIDKCNCQQIESEHEYMEYRFAGER